MDYVLSEESAAEQLDVLTQYYDIDLSVLPDMQAKVIQGVLLRAIRRGSLEIQLTNDGISVKQTLGTSVKGLPPVLEYAEVTGRAKQVVARLGDKASHHDQLMAFVSCLVKEDKNNLLDLRAKDGKVLEHLGTL